MRADYHDELGRIGEAVVAMARRVGSAMHDASQSLLTADLELAESVIAADEQLDAMFGQCEAQCFDVLATQSPVAVDLRTIVTTLRLTATLERMGDLAVHVAKIARMRYPAPAIPEELIGIFTRMGDLAQLLVDKSADVLQDQDLGLAAEIESEDDKIDDLHRQLFTTLISGGWEHDLGAAIDATLLSRYYERFGDHAVSLARRVAYLITGEMPEERISLGESA